MTVDQKAPRRLAPGVILPQRYSTKYERYLQLGGKIELSADAEAYAGADRLVDVERFVFLSLAFDQICKEGIEGDFAELGVYKGSTATLLARFARRLGKQIFLLDTFEGFSEKDFTDIDSGRTVGFGDTSLNAVKSRVGDECTHYIKGYFPETAERLPQDATYSLVHIDTDLYAPIRSGLEYFYPRMAPGGYLMIHDYGSLIWSGAEKAVDEFFADKPESIIQVPDSAGTAVVRRIRGSRKKETWIERKRTLPVEQWHKAENGRLSYNLVDGWSNPEAWGVWGVGRSHSIEIRPEMTTKNQFFLDLDIHAFVWDQTNGRRVGLTVNGLPATPLIFWKGREPRIVTIGPYELDKNGEIRIIFEHESFNTPQNVLLGSADSRPLGIALKKIRIRLA